MNCTAHAVHKNQPYDACVCKAIANARDKSFLLVALMMTSILLSLETRMKLSLDWFGLVCVHRSTALNFALHFYATCLRNWNR